MFFATNHLFHTFKVAELSQVTLKVVTSLEELSIDFKSSFHAQIQIGFVVQLFSVEPDLQYGAGYTAPCSKSLLILRTLSMELLLKRPCADTATHPGVCAV